MQLDLASMLIIFRKILNKLQKEDLKLQKDEKKRQRREKPKNGDLDSGVDDMSISETSECMLS